MTKFKQKLKPPAVDFEKMGFTPEELLTDEQYEAQLDRENDESFARLARKYGRSRIAAALSGSTARRRGNKLR